MTDISNYLNVIWLERQWSWAVIGVFYFFLWLTIRGWFLGPLIQKAKHLDKKYYHQIKRHYAKSMIWGWLFFIVSLGLVIYFWNANPVWPFTSRDWIIIASLAFCFFLALLLHVTAFGLASVKTLGQNTSEPKSLD